MSQPDSTWLTPTWTRPSPLIEWHTAPRPVIGSQRLINFPSTPVGGEKQAFTSESDAELSVQCLSNRSRSLTSQNTWSQAGRSLDGSRAGLESPDRFVYVVMRQISSRTKLRLFHCIKGKRVQSDTRRGDRTAAYVKPLTVTVHCG